MSPQRALARQLAGIYAMNNWRWGSPGEDHVPTADEIEKTIFRLKRELEERPGSGSMSTGRLMVSRDEDDPDAPFELTLFFGDLP